MANDGYYLVWEDTFSQDGPIDRNKWHFDIGTGANGWGNAFFAFRIRSLNILKW